MATLPDVDRVDEILASQPAYSAQELAGVICGLLCRGVTPNLATQFIVDQLVPEDNFHVAREQVIEILEAFGEATHDELRDFGRIFSPPMPPDETTMATRVEALNHWARGMRTGLYSRLPQAYGAREVTALSADSDEALQDLGLLCDIDSPDELDDPEELEHALLELLEFARVATALLFAELAGAADHPAPGDLED